VESFTRAVSITETDDLQALYENMSYRATHAYRVELLQTKLADRDAAHMGVKGLGDIAAILRSAVGALNRFKKVVASELANTGTWDEHTEGVAIACRKLAAIAEAALYSDAQTASGLKEANMLMRAWSRVRMTPSPGRGDRGPGSRSCSARRSA